MFRRLRAALGWAIRQPRDVRGAFVFLGAIAWWVVGTVAALKAQSGIMLFATYGGTVGIALAAYHLMTDGAAKPPA